MGKDGGKGGGRVGESGLSSSASHQTRLGKPGARRETEGKKKRIKATVEDKIIIAR